MFFFMFKGTVSFATGELYIEKEEWENINNHTHIERDEKSNIDKAWDSFFTNIIS